MREGVSLLQEIVLHKKQEVEARMERVSSAEIIARAKDAPPPRDFLAALQIPPSGEVALIAEVKKASPSAGIIRANFDPVQIARIYKENGAACLSVLTDEKFFQGHDDYLKAVKEAVRIPILRKDFTLYSYQIEEARVLGADAILLIAAILSVQDMGRLLMDTYYLGMAAIVEVHTEPELEAALEAIYATGHPAILGINSRNLNTFVTDLGTVERLAALVPENITLVAESGIKTPADVERVAQAGAKAILVGETLMRSPDIGAAVRELLG